MVVCVSVLCDLCYVPCVLCVLCMLCVLCAAVCAVCGVLACEHIAPSRHICPEAPHLVRKQELHLLRIDVTIAVHVTCLEGAADVGEELGGVGGGESPAISGADRDNGAGHG